MKDFSTLKSLPLVITTFIFLVSIGAIVTETFARQTEAVTQETAPAPSPATSEADTSSLPFDFVGFMADHWWWGIGLGVVVLVVILYFAFANMERKTASVFETTIIDDIVSALKDEFPLSENDLHNLASGIVATRRCSDSRLAGLLRIEYEVEKTSSSHVKRTTAVAVKKQDDFIVKKATRTMTWEDLPGAIRKEFILKNENLLVYSLYSDTEKEG